MFLEGLAIIIVLLFALWPALLLAVTQFGRRFSLRKMLGAVGIVAIVLLRVLAHRALGSVGIRLGCAGPLPVAALVAEWRASWQLLRW